MKPLISLSRQIDAIDHKISKESHERDWLTRTAEEMDIEIDPLFVKTSSVILNDSSDDEGRETTYRKEKSAKLRAQLDQMLAKPILPSGAIKSFLTGGIVSDMASKMLDPSSNFKKISFFFFYRSDPTPIPLFFFRFGGKKNREKKRSF
ncbi:ATP-dependent RNA helicase ddx24 [Smittium mucronatum]|uniref:ATP-dependent RNA helicase ddx24 n=1 Tax=Smittium mucronatum TaxID=133383 RepID=A0A1R0GLG6_9FUNG|nr:ATP-dependent RNA helicase ddx24 [Smittium mucronatum]